MPTPRLPRPETAELTPRQDQVAALLARGYTNARIAETLGISLDGAKYLVSEVITRLGVDTREEAADAWRARQGLAPRLRRFAGRGFAPLILRWVAIAAGGVVVAAVLLLVLQGGDEEAPAQPLTPTASSGESPTPQAPPPAQAVGRLAVLAPDAGSSRPFLLDIDGTVGGTLTAGFTVVHSAWWSPDGSKVAVQAASDPNGTAIEFWTISPSDPTNRQRHDLPGDLVQLDWAPDGRQLVAELRTDQEATDLHVLDVETGVWKQLTDTPGFEGQPKWSPDGSRIAFSTCRDCGAFFDVWVMDADGSNQRNLTPEPNDRGAFSWSPESDAIAYARGAPGGVELRLVAADGSSDTFLAGAAHIASLPAFSPDGERIAFIAADRGTWLLHLINRDGTGLRLLTDHGFGDVHPNGATPFSPDGSMVAYLRHGAVWIVEIETADEHRILGGVSWLHNWLPVARAGLDSDSLPPASTPVPYQGVLAPVPPGQLDDEGWPVVECGKGHMVYRMATRKISLCVPDHWLFRRDAEFTQDGYWGVSVEWSDMRFTLLERARSGPPSQFRPGCDIQEQAEVLGLPALVCVDRSQLTDEPPGPIANEASRWSLEMYAETPEYLVYVQAWGIGAAPAAEESIPEVLAIVASSRAGNDLTRVIP